MTKTQYAISFDELGRDDRPSVGGKCASLGELVGAGLPVPDGFAVTVAAFDDFRELHGLRDALSDLVTGAQGATSKELEEAHRKAVDMVLAAEIPTDIADPIRAAYADVAQSAAVRRGEAAVDGEPAVPVAVRSSSVDEDGDAASFAGQQNTYLWVCGIDEVLDKIKECWASLYTPQAIAYRSSMGTPDGLEASRISVAVQLMAAAEVAGVTFTVSPRTGDRSVIAINASYGLGQSVVSGEVTPDEYWISKVGPAITDRKIATKTQEYVPLADGSGIEFRDVDEARRGEACLSDDEVVGLATTAISVEKHYGAPQDIEWALERNADGTAQVMLLQSRPETNWKKRKAELAQKAEKPSPSSSLIDFVAAASKGPGTKGTKK